MLEIESINSLQTYAKHNSRESRMIADRIDTLRSYLLRLPKSLPVARDTSRYNFDQFSPDVDFIQENGEEAATN
jgi:hypothetical protein